MYSVDGWDVAFFLAGIIFAFVEEMEEALANDVFHRRISKVVTGAGLSLYAVCSIFFHQMYFFLPTVLMQAFGSKLIVAVVLSGGAIIYNAVMHPSPLNLMIPVLGILGIITESMADSVKIFEEGLHKERDYAREIELLMEERNKALTETQDSEVYAATLKERNRIAREIHDNVGHMLTRAILQTGAIKVVNKDENLKEPIEGLSKTLDLAMTNMRSSVHDLHDESVDLFSALNELTSGIKGFDIELEYDMGDDIPREIKYSFISIIKEALNNAEKHSNGDRILVSVMEQPGFYRLLVADNGNDTDIPSSSGIGLSNISDRVKALGGNLKIDTDDGFKILVTVIK